VDIQENCIETPTPSDSHQVVVLFIVSQSHNMLRQQMNNPNPQDEHMDDEPVNNEQVTNEKVIDEPLEMTLRRSKR